MIKFRVQSSLFVVFLIAIFLPTTRFARRANYELPTVHAADSTPSSDVKSKLEELKKNIASKAARLKDEVSQKLQNRAFVGFIKNKSANSLTLASLNGVKIVEFTQDSIFESRIKKRADIKKLKEEDFVAALGDIDETGVLTAKKVILLPTPKKDSKTYLWGQIISLSDSLATIKNKDLKNIAVSTSLADIKRDLKINEFIIMTGEFNKNEIFEAEFIYVIPQGGIIKPKKAVYPTPSATPKSTKP